MSPAISARKPIVPLTDVHIRCPRPDTVHDNMCAVLNCNCPVVAINIDYHVYHDRGTNIRCVVSIVLHAVAFDFGLGGNN